MVATVPLPLQLKALRTNSLHYNLIQPPNIHLIMCNIINECVHTQWCKTRVGEVQNVVLIRAFRTDAVKEAKNC